MGIMRGALTLRSSDCIESRYSRRLGPSYQGQISLLIRSLILFPLYAEIGMKNRSVLGLKPLPFKNTASRFVHSSYLKSISNLRSVYLSLLHSTVGSSILLIAITSLLIPCILARTACSRV